MEDSDREGIWSIASYCLDDLEASRFPLPVNLNRKGDRRGDTHGLSDGCCLIGEKRGVSERSFHEGFVETSAEV